MSNARPNIVWIYCDELRTDALACYGNRRLRPITPNLDALAASGIRFANNFCNSPVCVSSRVCTLTGLHPEDTGVYNNESAWKNFRMPRRPTTFPEVFAEAGYATAGFGKIHVSYDMMPAHCGDRPIFQHHDDRGGDMRFWEALGEQAVGMIRSPLRGKHGGMYPDALPYPPEAVARNAMAWMQSARQPFLVRVSILQPHTPVLPPERFVRMYDGQDAGLPAPLAPTLSAYERQVAAVAAVAQMDQAKLRLARLQYYAQVTWVDEQVGLVMDFLRAQGLLDNTIVLFGADHGNGLGDTGSFEKHVYNPTVHRVPLLLSFPGVVPGGVVREDVCDSLDVAPTLLALAGVDRPAQFKGRDLVHEVQSEGSYSTIGFGEVGSMMAPNGHNGRWIDGRSWPRRSCIRTGRWRLDKNMRMDGKPVAPCDEDIFLADVVADPLETVNLAGDPRYADVVADLSSRLDRHAVNAVEIPPEMLTR